MKQPELTENQKAILEEIAYLVIGGDQKLQEYSDESTAIDKKWRQRAEIKRAKPQKQA